MPAKPKMELKIRDPLSLKEREWLDSIAEESTSTTFKAITKRLPFSLDQVAQQPKLEAERQLISWIAEGRKVYKPSTMKLKYSVVKSFFDYYDAQVNWKKIRKSLPRIGKSQDRALTLEEIRVVFENCDIRGKFVLSLLASSGVRIGAFDYFTIKDLEVRENYGVLTVYRVEAEEYKTFVSRECVELFKKYLEERRAWGENITPDSPLVRNRVSHVKEERRLVKTSSLVLKNWLADQWNRRGIKNGFKQTHGFRKFFKTRLENTGMKSLWIEMLLGHDLGLHGNYIDNMDSKPQLEVIAEQYNRVQNMVWISESFVAKSEVKQLENSVSEQLARLRQENVILKQEAQKTTLLQEAMLGLQQKQKEAEERQKQSDQLLRETLAALEEIKVIEGKRVNG